MAVNKKNRHDSRVIAVQALFTYLIRRSEIDPETALKSVYELEDKEENDFAESLLQSAITHIGKIKIIIHAYAPDFSFDKIAPINRSVLILGIVELKYFDTPPIVVINEYIEIAKEFGEKRSAGFVNGVLDAFRQNIGKNRKDED